MLAVLDPQQSTTKKKDALIIGKSVKSAYAMVVWRMAFPSGIKMVTGRKTAARSVDLKANIESSSMYFTSTAI